MRDLDEAYEVPMRAVAMSGSDDVFHAMLTAAMAIREEVASDSMVMFDLSHHTQTAHVIPDCLQCSAMERIAMWTMFTKDDPEPDNGDRMVQCEGVDPETGVLHGAAVVRGVIED